MFQRLSADRVFFATGQHGICATRPASGENLYDFYKARELGGHRGTAPRYRRTVDKPMPIASEISA